MARNNEVRVDDDEMGTILEVRDRRWGDVGDEIPLGKVIGVVMGEELDRQKGVEDGQ